MKVKMFYDNGHFDIFETDTHVDKVFKGNVITDYSFDLAERDGRELWLTIYYHEASDAFREDAGPAGVPVSHRRDGWSVLLADAHDMEHLRRVSVDGETVLVRLLDELVDAQTMEYAADVAFYFTPRAVSMYDYYLKALGLEEGDRVNAQACGQFAVPPEVMRQLLERDELVHASDDDDPLALFKKLLG